MKATVIVPLLILATTAAAHKPSDSYLSLTARSGQNLHGQWDVAIRDLDFAIDLDRNLDGVITWYELRTRHNDISTYLSERISLTGNEVPCSVAGLDHLVDKHSDGSYAVWRFEVSCPDEVSEFEISYGLFFDMDPQHRGLLAIHEGEDVEVRVFSSSIQTQSFEIGEPKLRHVFQTWFITGARHIWQGVDHVLFIFSLLLPVALLRRKTGWEFSSQLRKPISEAVKVVTSFTVAHSVTLSLAVLGIVEVPVNAVEPLIAVSVLVVAMNNVYPLIKRRVWLVTFLFGLAHGFGFASALTDLGLAEYSIALPLVAFNLGVEAAQLLVVLSVFPAVYWLSRFTLYRRVGMPAISFMIVLVASVWLADRLSEGAFTQWSLVTL